MADFVAVLKKTIDGLGETTPEVREKVYKKARATVGAKLAALNPPPPPAVADRQRKALEDAITQIEAEYSSAATPPADDDDPLAELDALFAGMSKSKSPAPSQPPAPPAAAEISTSSAAIAAATKPEKAAATPEVQPSPLKGAELVPPEGVELPELDDEYPATPVADHAHAGSLEGADEPLHQPLPEPEDVPPPPRRDRSGLVKWTAGALAAIVVFGGAGYAMWLNRDSLADLIDRGQQMVAAEPASEQEVSQAPADTAVESEPAAVEVAAAPPAEEVLPEEPAGEEELQKYTQRLNPDGSEIDAGPASAEASIGEGTSVAAATQPAADAVPAIAPEQPAETPAADDAAVPVGQRTIFYEERTSVAQGSAEPGSIVWSLVQESPGGDLPPEPAIRAEANIPGKDLTLRMTIRRNADDSLPASHIVELIFLTPENFAGGAIDNVLRMTMKQTEEAAGSPLQGLPAKIADGFFLIALNDEKSAADANTALLRRQNWIDVPIVYKSGRRALITMEKGIPGEKVFEQALTAWQNASSG